MAKRNFDETDVAASWNRNADLWAREVRAGYDLYRELYTMPAFLDFMPPLAGKTAIDLGCGEGANTRLFAKLGGQMMGVDLSQEMIRRARQKEEEEPLGIAYEVGSYNDLASYADEQFDGALSTMALMDGPDLPAAIRAAHRVIKPGGFLCFSVLHPCFITPATQWLKDSDSSYSGLRIGRYFEREPFIEYWRFGRRPGTEVLEEYPAPFEVPRFPRTLSDYINTLIDAGFRIGKIAEPRPSAELAEKHWWLRRWHDHAPLVLFILAVRESAER